MSNTKMSLAKTTRPTLTMVLNRERLFRKLDNKHSKKAVWVFGPPGSGKTTLIASYIEANKHSSLWYQLDGNDADIASFFFYLRQSAIKNSLDSEYEIPELPAGVDDWDNYSRQLFRSIFTRFGKPLLIVFDNYESLPPYSDLHDIFRKVIDEVTENSLLVFISRSSPTPSMARSIANDQLSLIDADDLKLNDKECAQIAKLRKAKVTPDVLNKIMQSTAGWVTGMIIMLEYAKQSRFPENRQFGAAGNILFDYVANEVFSSFDDDARNILLKVCWPRRLNINMAEAIEGKESTGKLLGNLAKNNYFVTERDDTQGREYIIHPILRDFLQEKARETYDDETINELQNRIAELLIKDGQTEEAVELLAGNLNWKILEPIIIQHAPILIEQGRSGLLASWLEELPHDSINRNPWLLFWYGKARQKQAPREARHYFELAFQEFKKDAGGNREGMILCCCGVMEVVLAEMDDFSLLDNWINELTGLIKEGVTIPDFPFSISANMLSLLVLILRQPENESIEDRISQAEKSFNRPTHQQNYYRDNLCVTLVYLLTGHLEDAKEKIDLLFQHLDTIELSVLKCQLFLLSGLYHIFCGNGEDACKAAVNSLALAEENSINNLFPLIYACGCCAALTSNDPEESVLWIEKLAATGKSGHRLQLFLYHYILSWNSLISEDIINSHHEQRRALGYSVELGMPYFEVLSRTALGQLLFLFEDTRGVNAQLRRVHSIVRDMKNPLLEYMTLLVYGDIAMKQGRTSTGSNALRYALGLGRKFAYYHLPWWQSKQLSKVCAVALQNKIEVEYVRDFILRRNLQPVDESYEIQEWPWFYRIKTFGKLDIDMLDTVDLESTRNRGRPLQLLKILIAMGGRNINADAVAETLWPHVDKDYANRSLTINLHRLRRIIGNDDAIILRDGELTVNENLVWLDSWALEYQLGKIESSLSLPGNRLDKSEIIAYIDDLIEIYTGPFLSGSEEYSCFITARNHFRAEFIRGINLLVESLYTQDPAANAADIYEQCIQCDPYAEAIYRRLMLFYLDSDRQADAMDIYDRCRIAMSNTPQKTPSVETQSIYNRLVKMVG